jgi:hypothetical protein
LNPTGDFPFTFPFLDLRWLYAHYSEILQNPVSLGSRSFAKDLLGLVSEKAVGVHVQELSVHDGNNVVCEKGGTQVNIKAMWERARRTGQREVESALERDAGVVLHGTALAGCDEWGAGVLNTHTAGLGFVALIAPLETKNRLVLWSEHASEHLPWLGLQLGRGPASR